MADDVFPYLFLICMVLSGTSIITRQIIREKLFRLVLKKRNFTIDSSWYSITSHGIGTSFRMQYVWGEISKKMLKDTDLRSLILIGRLASVGLYLGITGLLLTLLWSFWS